MEPDEYVRTFFENIKSQLREAKLNPDGKGARYKNLVIATAWSGDLWQVQMRSDGAEPVQRQYDPLKARSSEAAANYFVDELRRAMGEEPLPRPEVASRRYGAARAKNLAT